MSARFNDQPGSLTPAELAKLRQLIAAYSVSAPLVLSGNALTLPNATTATAGAESAADKLHFNALWQPGYVRYYRAAAHAALTSNTLTTIAYDTLDYPVTAAAWVNVAGTFTLQVGSQGLWDITARVRWTAVAGTTSRGLRLHKNGALAEMDERHSSNNSEITNEVRGLLNLAAGDTIDARGLQISGGNLAPLNTQSGTCIFMRFVGSP